VELDGFLHPRLTALPVRSSQLRLILSVAAIPLPQPAKRWVYRKCFGWSVANDALVGLSWLAAANVTLGPGARIGHFNFVPQTIGDFRMGARSYLRHGNQFSAPAPSEAFPDRVFVLGDDALVMSWHFFDVAGNLSIGRQSTIGGRGSQFWTHSLLSTPVGRVLTPRDLVIGDETYVGASVVIVHCEVPAGVTIGAGTVLSGKLVDATPGCVIAGNPGRVVRRPAAGEPPRLTVDVSGEGSSVVPDFPE
jgi:acetyltransferase-like isoleucine patch superfamily enzyme